jgi:hypothetical protein
MGAGTSMGAIVLGESFLGGTSADSDFASWLGSRLTHHTNLTFRGTSLFETH